MPEIAHKRQLTSTVRTILIPLIGYPLMTPIMALPVGLSIRLSMFELLETGDWDLFRFPGTGEGGDW